MTKYQPIIQYCQERVKSLTDYKEDHPHYNFIMLHNKPIVEELFRLITLCEKLDEQENMLLEKLGLPKV